MPNGAKQKGPRRRVPLKVSATHAVPKKQAAAERKHFSQVRKSVAFLAAVALAYVLYLVFSGQMGTFLAALAGVDKSWIAAAIACYAAYYVLGVLAYVLAVIADPTSPVGIRDLMSVEALGIFFSNLSPGGTGSVPVQIIRLTRVGLSVGEAGALQYTRFIVYEVGEGLFAALMLVFRAGYFLETYGDVFLVGVALFGFKIVEVCALLFVCFFPHVVTRVGTWVIGFLSRRGWLKDRERWDTLVGTQVVEFAKGFRHAVRNHRQMLLTLLVTLAQLGCLFALPWFVLNAFGRPADLVTCMTAAAMLELLTSAIPLPGGTGGAEGGFAFLFGPMFGESAVAGFVVWRMVEYFLPILAMTPLLGLRSGPGESINRRWKRFAGRVRGATAAARPRRATTHTRPTDIRVGLGKRGDGHTARGQGRNRRR